MWFQQRTGYVTVSRLKSVSTDVSQPSISLIKLIYYPDGWCTQIFSVTYSYGCKHKDAAWKEYVCEIKRKHAWFAITKSGLVLDSLYIIIYPFLGATPDGLVSCECCSIRNKMSIFLQAKTFGGGYWKIQGFLYQSEEGVTLYVAWNKESWINHRIYANGDDANATINFIKLGILPELVGRWYKKQSLHCDQPSTQPSSTQPLSIQPAIMCWTTSEYI